MKKKRIIIALIVFVCALTVLIFTFDNLKQTLNGFTSADGGSQIIAQTKDIQITQEQFEFYKSAAEAADSLNTPVQSPSDEELIHNLFISELTALEAGKQGITVSDTEVNEQIEFQRTSFENHKPVTEEEKLVYELMENRIRNTGLSEDEFWNHDLVMEEYKKSLLSAKLMKHLAANEEIADAGEFTDYKEQLLKNVQDEIQYNQELLDELREDI
ncbi:SurA N-terminal domain-containing protein [Neobacillus mesonae]|nr:SurA N-terminal domain-containing protein [Neobacillus mesonae]